MQHENSAAGLHTQISHKSLITKKLVTDRLVTKRASSSASAQASQLSHHKKDAEDFETLGIEERGTVCRKPRFRIHSKVVINPKSEFKEKLLCDGLTFTAGHACAFSCTFCYVEAMLKKNKRLALILEQKKLNFEDVTVEIAEAPTMARKFLASRGTLKFPDPADNRVIFGSPLVDVAATMAHVKDTVEICRAVLEMTHWQIRLLSKSSLLLQVAKAIPAEFKDRVIYGFSTGTFDSEMARVYEIGTGRVSKRLEALHLLQDGGYRTFGMICPILPQSNYSNYKKFAAEIAKSIRVEQCEYVWAEALNGRSDSFQATSSALRRAGYEDAANNVDKVASDKRNWEIYSRQVFSALSKVVPPQKLRFLQYVNKETYPWWEKQVMKGAVLLGKTAHKEDQENAIDLPPLTDKEREDFNRLESVVTENMSQFVAVGLALTEIRDRNLHRETGLSFEDYCFAKYDLHKAHAHRLIKAAHVMTELSPIGDKESFPLPRNEAQARELAKAPAKLRVEVMKRVANAIGQSPMTAKDIAESVAAVKIANGRKAPSKPANAKLRSITVKSTDFHEWLQLLKRKAEQNQMDELIGLLDQAIQEQGISLKDDGVTSSCCQLATNDLAALEKSA